MYMLIKVYLVGGVAKNSCIIERYFLKYKFNVSFHIVTFYWDSYNDLGFKNNNRKTP